jgi:hypothetical protein
MQKAIRPVGGTSSSRCDLDDAHERSGRIVRIEYNDMLYHRAIGDRTPLRDLLFLQPPDLATLSGRVRATGHEIIFHHGWPRAV